MYKPGFSREAEENRQNKYRSIHLLFCIYAYMYKCVCLCVGMEGGGKRERKTERWQNRDKKRERIFWELANPKSVAHSLAGSWSGAVCWGISSSSRKPQVCSYSHLTDWIHTAHIIQAICFAWSQLIIDEICT